MRHDYVAVAIRVDHTALVGVNGHELRRVLEKISDLLHLPPRVLMAIAVVMIPYADPVQRRRVKSVTPGVFQ